MKKEYVLAFSSFYKAAYAQEKLAEQGIRAAVRKLLRSCGYDLYLLSSSIQRVVSVLSENEIDFRGAYEITNIDGSSTYKRVV